MIEPGPLRRLTSPVLALAVERWEAVNAALDAGAVMLRKAGIDPPLGSATVFEITPEGRRAVEIASGQARLAAGEIPLGRLAAEIRRRPDEFSPGAALRPVLQDAVLPVVATLGGPSELAYLWQIIPVYEALGVTPSRCAPRISATFVEEKVMRAARKAGLGPERLFEAGRLLGTYDTEADRDPAIDNIEERAAGLLGEIDRAAGEFLPPGTPPRWLRRSASTIRSAVDRLAAQLHEEKRKAAGLDRSRLEKIASALLPGGIPQERSANIVEFLNLHGPEFVRLSVEALDPASGRHQVVLVSTVRE